MTMNNLSKGLLKRLCVQIGCESTPKLEQLVEAYHQAKCEGEPVGYAPSEYLANIKEEMYVLASKPKKGIYDTPLFTAPQPDAEAKLSEAMKILHQIADMPRKTRERNLAYSFVAFIETMNTDKQALEKIGE